MISGGDCAERRLKVCSAARSRRREGRPWLRSRRLGAHRLGAAIFGAPLLGAQRRLGAVFFPFPACSFVIFPSCLQPCEVVMQLQGQQELNYMSFITYFFGFPLLSSLNPYIFQVGIYICCSVGSSSMFVFPLYFLGSS